MNAPRQTLSYLQARFRDAGLRPDVRHGQNFLIDLNLLEILADSAEIGPDDVILEVGTGMGSLTSKMADRAAHVVTVEIDPHLQQLASEELAFLPNVTLLQQDALRTKNAMAEEVLAAVQQQLDAAPNRQFKLCSNLPYNVATPILSNLLTSQPRPVSLTATIQLELAERIVAHPGTKDYSGLSIWIQSLCDCKIVRTMPPDVFWPKPKVYSAIVNLVPSDEKRAKIHDLKFFHELVRGLFLHRRKLLRGVLIALTKAHLSKENVDALLAEMQFKSDVRAEQLPPEILNELAQKLQARLPAGVSPLPGA